MFAKVFAVLNIWDEYYKVKKIIWRSLFSSLQFIFVKGCCGIFLLCNNVYPHLRRHIDLFLKWKYMLCMFALCWQIDGHWFHSFEREANLGCHRASSYWNWKVVMLLNLHMPSSRISHYLMELPSFHST